MSVKPLNNYWVVIDESSNPQDYTIAGTEQESIRLFMEQGLKSQWVFWANKGYRCANVNIDLTEI